MKRKRGNKKGKPKKPVPAARSPSPAADESSSAADEEPMHEDVGGSRNHDAPASPMAVEKEETAPLPPPPPAPAPPPQPRPVAKPPLVVFNRMKVKLKTSKPPPSAPAVILPTDVSNTSRKKEESGGDKAEERREESAAVIKGSGSGNAAPSAVAEGSPRDEPKSLVKVSASGNVAPSSGAEGTQRDEPKIVIKGSVGSAAVADGARREEPKIVIKGTASGNAVQSAVAEGTRGEEPKTLIKGFASGNAAVAEGTRREESKIVVKGSALGNVVPSAVAEGIRREEPKTPLKPRFDKLELDSALMIIKKVMKMDAAEPFNVPVNPEALGIPDYFDIIDTPMDFGTICTNLEKGNKYMNSEDVYGDVQFIWDNCSKYNKKGDYIVDLMKRVKKNFMKYWTAAGLYTEPTRASSGTEGVTGEDIVASTHAPVKTKKTKKRHGRRHKSDCLCAVCILKRRRREREENEQLAKGQVASTDREYKQEESSLMESPDGGEDSSSDMGESRDPDAEGDVEGKELELKAVEERQIATLEVKLDEEADGDNEDKEEEETERDAKKRKVEVSEQSHFTEKQAQERVQQVQHVAAGDEDTVDQIHTDKPPELVQLEEDLIDFQPTKHKELLKSAEKAKLRERFQEDNPLLVGLCSSLFPRNRRSVWNGPHSLVPYQGPTRKGSIYEAIEALMK